MNVKLPQIDTEQDRAAKISNVIQLILFLVLFIGGYLLLRRLVHAWYWRVLILLGDYFVVSLLTYTVIRPLLQKLETKLREKQ